MEMVVSNESDKTLNYVSNPANILQAAPWMVDKFDYISQMRQYTDDIAKYTSQGRIAGGSGDIKIVARIPEAVLITVMAVEPNLLKDKKTFYKWLNANPQYEAYTRKRIQ